MSGVEPIIIGSLLGGAGAFGFSKVSAKSAPKAPSSPAPMPQAPSPSATQEAAQQTVKKKKAGFTQSVYTSPLGVSGQASVARKTLLGQ